MPSPATSPKLEKFRSSARTAFLCQTQCTSRQFMRFLLGELGFETDRQDFVRSYEECNKYLLQEARAGNRFLVVIDEAQNLDASVLKTVRLLSNFESPHAKLLQIVLAGQPELADKLASRGLAQFRQRISLLSRLQPLSPEETKDYIQHRLSVAGYVGGPLLTSQALAIIIEFTEGMPGNINNICFNALSLACAMRQKIIDTAIAHEVIADLDISQYLSLRRYPGRQFRACRFRRYTPRISGSHLRPVRNGKHENLTLAEAKA